MSPLTAWSFTLLGISLSFLTSRKITWVLFLCAPQISLIGLVSLLGYFWNVKEIITDALVPPVAVHAGFTLVVLALGVLASRNGQTRFFGTLASRITTVELKLIAGMGLVFIVAVSSFGYTYRASLELLNAFKWVEHTQEVRLVLKDN